LVIVTLDSMCTNNKVYCSGHLEVASYSKYNKLKRSQWLTQSNMTQVLLTSFNETYSIHKQFEM